jgi:hypothetical protein
MCEREQEKERDGVIAETLELGIEVSPFVISTARVASADKLLATCVKLKNRRSQWRSVSEINKKLQVNPNVT